MLQWYGAQDLTEEGKVQEEYLADRVGGVDWVRVVEVGEAPGDAQAAGVPRSTLMRLTAPRYPRARPHVSLVLAARRGATGAAARGGQRRLRRVCDGRRDQHGRAAGATAHPGQVRSLPGAWCGLAVRTSTSGAGWVFCRGPSAWGGAQGRTTPLHAEPARFTPLALRPCSCRASIRVLVRDVAAAKAGFGPYIDPVSVDVGATQSLARALRGVRTLVLLGRVGGLLAAAKQAGVEKVVLLSTAGAAGARGGAAGAAGAGAAVSHATAQW